MTEKLHLRPLVGECVECKKKFNYSIRKQGGGPKQKYCSHACAAKRWLIKNPSKRKAVVKKYESIPENKTRKQANERRRWLHRQYGWKEANFNQELERQNYSCYGCLERLDNKTARVDHCRKKNRVRGILCDSCNRGLGWLKENPSTFRRLIAYLDRDREVTSIYLIGSLKNNRIPEIGNRLRKEGYDVMDEWFTPGPEADDNWQKYERQRGRTYAEALRGRAASNIFNFDRSYIDHADFVILVSPAGKSAMIELGYAKGRGKKAYILLDGVEPERFDIMPGFADEIFKTEADLLNKLSEIKNEQRS